jgi:hypothetical protein
MCALLGIVAAAALVASRGTRGRERG